MKSVIRLTNYWIFKANDDSDGEHTLTGLTIYRHRMEDKAWGIKEYKKNGQRASNVTKLGRGNKVVFYLCGSDGHCFLGRATLETGFPLTELVVHKEYLDWKHGVKLTDIKQWVKPVQIKPLEGRLSFFAEGETNWGAHLQGAITRITESDYKTIEDAAS